MIPDTKWYNPIKDTWEMTSETKITNTNEETFEYETVTPIQHWEGLGYQSVILLLLESILWFFLIFVIFCIVYYKNCRNSQYESDLRMEELVHDQDGKLKSA